MAGMGFATCEYCGVKFAYPGERDVPPKLCGLDHRLLKIIRACPDRVFIRCDAHPSKGGPHKSRGLYVRPYFDHKADIVACTHLSKRGKVCGAEMLMIRR